MFWVKVALELSHMCSFPANSVFWIWSASVVPRRNVALNSLFDELLFIQYKSTYPLGISFVLRIVPRPVPFFRVGRPLGPRSVWVTWSRSLWLERDLCRKICGSCRIISRRWFRATTVLIDQSVVGSTPRRLSRSASADPFGSPQLSGCHHRLL